jgi:hypothetical protein
VCAVITVLMLRVLTPHLNTSPTKSAPDLLPVHGVATETADTWTKSRAPPQQHVRGSAEAAVAPWFPLLEDHQACSLPGLRVGLIHTHMEGNLGDEMETTPILLLLRHWCVELTIFSARWQIPPRRVGANALRTLLAMAPSTRIILSSVTESDVTWLHDSFDVLIQAPGPMVGGLCRAMEPLPKPIPYLLWSVSVHTVDKPVPDTACAGFWMVREHVSERLLLKTPVATRGNAPPIFMGADYTLTYPLHPPLMDAWAQVWHMQFGNYLQPGGAGIVGVFARGNNFGYGTKLVHEKQTLEILLFNNETVQYELLPSSTTTSPLVVFVSSSAIEDESHMRRLISLGIPKERALVFTAVEQMAAFVRLCTRVYSDRYHPAVISHRVGTPVSVIAYPAEAIKMQGIEELIARYTPEQLSSMNHEATQQLYSHLLQLPRKGTGISADADEGT